MGPDAATRVIGGVTIAWLACFAYLTLTPDLPDVPGLAFRGRVMGAGHLVASLVLGALVYLWIVTARPSVPTRRAAVVAVGATWGFGLLVELAQVPIPNRGAEAGDAVLDLAGAVLGAGALVAVSRRALRHRAVPAITGAVGVVLVATTAGLGVWGSTDTAAEIRCPGRVDGGELPPSEQAPAADRPPGRVGDGLVAEYVFSGRSGAGTGRSGTGAAAPALVARGSVEPVDPRGVRFASDDAVLTTDGPAPEIADAVDEAFTIEAWVRPDRLTGSGPARIVSSSDGTALTDVNVQLGQERHCLSVRVDAGGPEAEWLLVEDVFATSRPAWHLVVTDERGTLRVYVDGEQQAVWRLDGARLSGWSADHPLLVGNEATRDRPFAGEVYLVAVYDRALSPTEVTTNHGAGF